MLEFILGTAGTGKTTRLMERLQEAVEAGGRAILLVPEQYSFEAERLLIRVLGERRALEVEVLSFTRLASSIFRQFGGLAGVAVSDAGKYLLMSVALEELKDELTLYRKSTANTAFLQSMLEACGELKTAGLTPGRLEEIGEECPDAPLRDKLRELGLVYCAYQGLLTRGYVDPEDDLIRACALLREGNDFFGGCSLFVDGFTTFMAAEFALLEQAVRQADRVVFAMTADSLHDETGGVGVFSPVKSALRRLIRIAGRNGVPVGSPQVLEQPVRYRHPALAHLSRNLLQPVPPAYQGEPGESVRLHQAADSYGECAYIAAKIASLVREEGYRYNQIVVVGRDLDPYLRGIEIMFSRYGIPYFCDSREEAESFPLFSGLMSALDAVRSNFDPHTVLLYAKSPLAGFDPEEVSALENYCYCWGVRGAGWLHDFANNPRGLADEITHEDRELLEEINRLRERVTAPLARLKRSVNGGDGKGFATGIYDFLEEIGAADHMTAYAETLEQGERESFLDAASQLWDSLMEILDVFGAVLGGVGISARRLLELFRLAVSAAEVAQVPQTLDQVLLGQADRIRPGDTRAVFVLGANEGVFPPQVSSGGLFTDAERRTLTELGAELSAPTLERTVLERYFGYFALTIPQERLYLCYSRGSLLGGELLPSVLVQAVEELFPGLEPEPLDDLERIAGDKPALHLLADRWRQDTPMTASLREYFGETAAGETLERMNQSAGERPHRIMDRRVARSLFGGRMRLSPSRVERYYRCPFSYFAADGLKLRKRRRVEFTPLESGSVIHNVLQVMVQRHGGKGLAALSEEAMKKEIREIIQDYLTQRIEDMESIPTRFKSLFTRLTGMLARLLAHMGREFAQSQFDVAAVELPIGGEGVEPLELLTPGGVPVTVEGVVDRVDVMEKDGRRFVRVVDYKSGVKEFKLHDVLYGLNLQMLLYLFTIGENGKGPLEGAIPAGVLYMPVRESYLTASREDDAETLAKAREKQWKMNGLLLEDEEALRGMEQDMAGVYIPVKMKKDGTPDKGSSLATPAQMGSLALKVKQLVVDMAQSLSAGGIDALPARGADYDACAHCDYKAVCGHEQGGAAREIAAIDREELFQMLEGNGNG